MVIDLALKTFIVQHRKIGFMKILFSLERAKEPHLTTSTNTFELVVSLPLGQRSKGLVAR